MQRSLVAISVLATLLFAEAAVAGINSPGGGSGGSPTGSAGGDLAGTYPNPNVKSVTGRSFALPATVEPAIDIGTAGAALGGGMRWEIHGNSNNTDAPFGWGMGDSTFTCNPGGGNVTKYDDTWYWGYNVGGPGGGRIVNTAPQWNMQLEADYYAVEGAGCEDLMEFSLNMLTPAGANGGRFVGLSVDRNAGGNGTGAAGWQFNVGTGSGAVGNTFTIGDTGGNTIWNLTATQNGSWRSLDIQTNNIAALLQKNAAGNADIEIARIDASNILNIGNGSSAPASAKIGPTVWDWGSNAGTLVSSGAQIINIGNSTNKTLLAVKSYEQQVVDMTNANASSSHWSLDVGSGAFLLTDQKNSVSPLYVYDNSQSQLVCIRATNGGAVGIKDSCGPAYPLDVGGDVNSTGAYREGGKIAIGSSIDHYVGGSGSAAIGTSATGPFLYLSTSAGAPTGTPAGAGAGMTACQYDTTNHKLWCYDQPAAAWRGVVIN